TRRSSDLSGPDDEAAARGGRAVVQGDPPGFAPKRGPAPEGSRPGAGEVHEGRGVAGPGDGRLQEGADRVRSDDADPQQAGGRLRRDPADADLAITGLYRIIGVDPDHGGRKGERERGS